MESSSTADRAIDIKIPEKLECLIEPRRYKAIYGGRGTGKSHGVALALLVLGRNLPLRILCAREVQKSIKDSVKQLLDDKIKDYGMSDFYQSLQNEIRGINGTTFLFAGLGTMTADQLKSMEGVDICWVEEAQTISERSLEILIPTIRSSKNLPESELWFTWNPRNASDPVDVLFRGDVTPPGAMIIRMNPRDNPFFPEELKREMEFDKVQKPYRFDHIWHGEYEPMAIGAIWNRVNLRENRRAEAPEMGRILVGIDPAISSEERSNEHGIIVAGVGIDGRGYVLDDMSLKGTPGEWAKRAVTAFDKWQADGIVIEVNQGGDMVKHTLSTVRPHLPIIEVRASRGKHVRAEPISALYDVGKISHVGTFEQLESQMCQMTASGFEGEGSPDRCDALVWTLTQLFPKILRKPKKEVPVAQYASEGGWMG